MASHGQKQIKADLLKGLIMKEILITFKASRRIIKQSQLCPVETGGILVGILNPLAIVAAGKPGPNSTQQATQFTSDPEADRACLEDARTQFDDKITPVGYWHKHPENLSEPSSADCHQARQLVKEYNDGQPFLMGIVNYHPKLVKHRTTLHLYSIDLAGKLLEHAWRLVSSKDKRLLDAIKKAPVRLDLKPISYWLDKDFQSYLNPIGRDRIKQEVENLGKIGWDVTTARRKHDKALLLDVLKDSKRLCFVLPPEFPLNPPTVLTGDGKRFLGLDTLCKWNSLRRLSDVAAEASVLMSCTRCSRQCID
jgi:hypothetical protein